MRVDIPIVGDVKDVLQELIHQIKEAQAKPDAAAVNAWWSQIGEWRRKDCLSYKGSDEVIKPQMVVETLWRLTRSRCLHHLGRGPAPDVGCAVLQVR